MPVRARRRTEWVRGEQQLLPKLARRAGVDLVHSLANTGPARGRFRRVVTIHDLIHRVHPEAHFGVRGVGMRILVSLAARTSDRVIADSESTRGDLVRLLGMAEDRIDVAPLGLGATRATAPMPERSIRATNLARYQASIAGERSLRLKLMRRMVVENVVRRAYRSVLNREPDSASEGYVEHVLRDGWSQADVERDLRRSAEYLNRNR